MIEPLIAMLADPDPKVLQQTILSLQEIPDPRIIELLIGMLSNPDPQVRHQVVKTLGGTNDPRVAQLLLNSLSDTDTKVLQDVALALGRFFYSDICNLVYLILTDSLEAVFVRAIIVFEQVKDIQQIEPLKALLKNPNPRIRQKTVVALTHLDHPIITELCLELLRDPDPQVRQEVTMFLEKPTNSQAVD